MIITHRPLLCIFMSLTLAAGNAEKPHEATKKDDALKQEILDALRPPPVLDFPTKKTTRVASVREFKQAIEQLHKAPISTTILFEKGSYAVSLDDLAGDQSLFALKGLENLIIDGGNSHFQLADPRVGICDMNECRNVILRNFSVDYETLPFTQGVVQSVQPEESTYLLKLDEGFPLLTRWKFPNNSIAKDPNIPGKLRDGFYDYCPVEAYESLDESGRMVRVRQAKWRPSDFQPGDRVVFTHRASPPYRPGPSYWARKSVNPVFANITTYACNSVYMLLKDNQAPAVVGCQLRLKERRLQASQADGFHLAGNAPGIWIENCLIEGTGDDGINIHADRRGQLLGKKNNRTFLSRQEAEIGDLLWIYRPKEGRHLASARVESIKPGPYPWCRWITLDRDVPEARPSSELMQHLIETNGAEHHGHIDDVAYRSDTFHADKNERGFVIRNNTIRKTRRHGIYIQTSNGLIEGNTIQYCSGVAMMLAAMSGWNEGYPPYNILVRNNTFDTNNFDFPAFEGTEKLGDINVEAWKFTGRYYSDSEPSEAHSVHGIVIEDNHFKRLDRGFNINIVSARDVFIRNNIFEGTSQAGNIYLYNARDVVIRGNRVPGELVIRRSGPQDNVTVKD